MTTRYDDKDPADVITVEFDFGELADSVSAPTVSITVLAGADPDAATMLDGSPNTIGAKVFQRIRNGVAGVDYALQCLAYNSADRYSIEAILPVRARPVASNAVPVYLTEAQFEKRFGQGELADLLSGGTNYAEAENEAAGLVNGYLSARYTLPLASVPTMLQGWVADITRYRLWDEHAPEEVRRRYEDALAQLKLVSQGVIALPPGIDGAAAAQPLNFGGYSARRVFTDCTLKGY